MEPENHPFGKEKHLKQTSIFEFHVCFRGCILYIISLLQALIFPNHPVSPNISIVSMIVYSMYIAGSAQQNMCHFLVETLGSFKSMNQMKSPNTQNLSDFLIGVTIYVFVV